MVLNRVSKFLRCFVFAACVSTSSLALSNSLEGISMPSFAGGSPFTAETLANAELTVVQFWAHWCTNCKKNVKDIYELQKEIPFQFVAASVDDEKSDADSFFAKEAENPKYALFQKDAYYDVNKALQQKLKARSLPTIIVLDRQGNIVGKKIKGKLNSSRKDKLREILTSIKTKKGKTK